MDATQNISLPTSTWRDRLKKVSYKLDQYNQCYKSVTPSSESIQIINNTIVTPSEILDDFITFTKKHPDLKQQDILSQFILEGIQKYNR